MTFHVSAGCHDGVVRFEEEVHLKCDEKTTEEKRYGFETFDDENATANSSYATEPVTQGE